MRHLIAIALVLAAAPHADADTCGRWVNDIDPCDGVVAQNVCNDPSAWTPNQWIAFSNWNYSSTAADACRKYVMKNDPDANWRITVIDPETVECMWDDDDDGFDDSDMRKIMRYSQVPKDECCSRVPRSDNPYASVENDTEQSDTGEFSEPHRKRILAKNNGSPNGPAKSDASKARVQDTGADAFGNLAVASSTFTASDDPLTPSKTTLPGVTPGNVANIDHIIPRVDSKGCRCGDNASANAAVISAELNASMGRSCLDPRRQAFLQRWTTMPAALSAPQSEPSEDDAPTSTEAGGCTATPSSAGLLAMGLGLVALGGRRRKR